MIKFAYVVPEEEAGFTKYIAVTLDSHKSGVILDTIMKFCPEPFLGQSEQMLLVTFLATSFPFSSAKIQMRCTIHYSRNPCVILT